MTEKKPTFNEVFLPFRVKKSTTLAPINHFKQSREVIVLDGEGEVKTEYASILNGMSADFYRYPFIIVRRSITVGCNEGVLLKTTLYAIYAPTCLGPGSQDNKPGFCS
jgi:hypothetical protein